MLAVDAAQNGSAFRPAALGVCSCGRWERGTVPGKVHYSIIEISGFMRSASSMRGCRVQKLHQDSSAASSSRPAAAAARWSPQATFQVLQGSAQRRPSPWRNMPDLFVCQLYAHWKVAHRVRIRACMQQTSSPQQQLSLDVA